MAATNKKRDTASRKVPPAKTPEGREQQLINLSMDLAELQLAKGTASAQVLTHFLRLGTVKAKLELEKTIQENLLLKAKTEHLESLKNLDSLYAEALDAMRQYQGQDDDSV